MLEKLRNKIREKRNSKNIIWVVLFLIWRFLFKPMNRISENVFYIRTIYFSPSKSLAQKSIMLKAAQIEEEFGTLIDILSKKELSNVLEIGTYKGGALFAWCKLADNNAKIISVDLLYKRYNAMVDYDRTKKIYSRFYKTGGQELFIMLKNSHEQDTLDTVKEILDGDKLDFLFIDGDHSYEGVKRDFEMYSTLVKRGGVIVLHDIVPYSEYGVAKYWQEIKNKFHHKEIVNDWNGPGWGIGVILK